MSDVILLDYPIPPELREDLTDAFAEFQRVFQEYEFTRRPIRLENEMMRYVPTIEGADMLGILTRLGLEAISVPHSLITAMTPDSEAPQPMLVTRTKRGHAAAFLASLFDVDHAFFDITRFYPVPPEVLEDIQTKIRAAARNTEKSAEAAADFFARKTETLID